MAVVINGVEIGADRLAFLQDVELENRLVVEIFFIGVIAAPIGFLRWQGGRQREREKPRSA